jgi:hypothetical protein
LDLAPTINICKPQRKATYIEHRRLIFEHLQFSNFDPSAKAKLENWIIVKTQEGQILTEQLYNKAEQFLILNKNHEIQILVNKSTHQDYFKFFYICKM